MKKKHKFIFKVDSNLRAKVYLNGKWQKNICEIEIFGEPYNYTIGLVQHVLKDGHLIVADNNCILKKTSTYKFARKGEESL